MYFNSLNFFQLEQHNHELEIKNDVLTDQVEILRERLQALPASTAKEIFKSQQVKKYNNSCRIRKPTI